MCGDLFGVGARLWKSGAVAHVVGALECVVQIDDQKLFVDVWIRCAPADLEAALKFFEQVGQGKGRSCKCVFFLKLSFELSFNRR